MMKLFGILLLISAADGVSVRRKNGGAYTHVNKKPHEVVHDRHLEQRDFERNHRNLADVTSMSILTIASMSMATEDPLPRYSFSSQLGNTVSTASEITTADDDGDNAVNAQYASKSYSYSISTKSGKGSKSKSSKSKSSKSAKGYHSLSYSYSFSISTKSGKGTKAKLPKSSNTDAFSRGGEKLRADDTNMMGRYNWQTSMVTSATSKGSKSSKGRGNGRSSSSQNTAPSVNSPDESNPYLNGPIDSLPIGKTSGQATIFSDPLLVEAVGDDVTTNEASFFNAVVHSVVNYMPSQFASIERRFDLSVDFLEGKSKYVGSNNYKTYFEFVLKIIVPVNATYIPTAFEVTIVAKNLWDGPARQIAINEARNVGFNIESFRTVTAAEIREQTFVTPVNLANDTGSTSGGGLDLLIIICACVGGVIAALAVGLAWRSRKTRQNPFKDTNSAGSSIYSSGSAALQPPAVSEKFSRRVDEASFEELYSGIKRGSGNVRHVDNNYDEVLEGIYPESPGALSSVTGGSFHGDRRSRPYSYKGTDDGLAIPEINDGSRNRTADDESLCSGY